MTKSDVGIHDMDYRMELLSWLACLTLFSLSIGTAPTSLFSGVFVLVWLLTGAWRNGWAWWRTGKEWLLPVLLVMLLPWLSLFWTIAPSPKLYPYLQRTHFWFLTFATVCIVFRSIQIKHLSLALVAGVQVNVLLFLFFKLGLSIPYPKLYSFMEQGRITYSLLLALAIALLSFWFRESNVTKQRICLLIVIALNLVVLAMQTGRSGYLAFFVMAPLVAGNILGWRRWWGIVIASIFLVGIFFFSPAVQKRITIINTESNMYYAGAEKAHETSVGTRLALWKGAVRVFSKHPLIGVGIDGYPVAMKRLYPDWNAALTNPHNFYLYVAASYGLLGISLYGWLWTIILRRAWINRNRWSGFMALSTLLVVSVGSLTEITPLLPQTGILLAMMVGLPRED